MLYWRYGINFQFFSQIHSPSLSNQHNTKLRKYSFELSYEPIFKAVFILLKFQHDLFYIMLSEAEFVLHWIHTRRKESNQQYVSRWKRDFGTQKQTRRN
jgi:hypothetical protein